jgi:glycosyltransferase involved in cell wall biosynthesis
MKNAIENEGIHKSIFVAPNSCDKSFFNSEKKIREVRGVNKGTKIFIYFGSIGLMDDVHYLVKEFEEANLSDSVFLIFGDGAERMDVENYINNNKIMNIILMGMVPKHEVFSWLNMSYASLIAYKNYKSLQDSSPNKLFDSLAFGIPVLHNTTGWIKDLVDDHEIGISSNPKNIGEMAKSIKFLCDNPDIREVFSKNAVHISETYFNRRKISNDYLKRMKEILSEVSEHRS